MLYAECVDDCMTIDGCNEGTSEEDFIAAYQRLIDSGVLFCLQGSRVRTGLDLVAAGLCHLPQRVHIDA